MQYIFFYFRFKNMITLTYYVVICFFYKGSTLRAPYSSQSVRQRFLELVRTVFFLSLTQSALLKLHPESAFGNVCAMTLNHVSRSNVKITAHLYVNSLSGAYHVYPQSNLAHNFPHTIPVVKGWAVTLNGLYKPRVNVIPVNAKIPSPEHIFSLLSPVWLFFTYIEIVVIGAQ